MKNKSNPDILNVEDIGTIKRPSTPKKKVEKSMKKPIIITVILTLVIVAAFAATFIAGMKYADNIEAGKREAVQAAQQLKDPAPQQ